MTPPNQFWPFYDDLEVEIYDNPSWDMPGRTLQPASRKPQTARVKKFTPSESSR